MNITIDILGKPKPKSRPRFNRNTGRVWTPTTPHEDAVAMSMLKHQGTFKGGLGMSISAWFYGPDPRSDLDNLGKLIVDAVVKAGVIDDDNVKVLVCQMFEVRNVDDESNAFPGKASTRIRIGDWL